MNGADHDKRVDRLDDFPQKVDRPIPPRFVDEILDARLEETEGDTLDN